MQQNCINYGKDEKRRNSLTRGGRFGGRAVSGMAARGVASLLGDGRRRAALALLLMFELARRLAAWLEDVAAYYIYLHSNTW